MSNETQDHLAAGRVATALAEALEDCRLEGTPLEVKRWAKALDSDDFWTEVIGPALDAAEERIQALDLEEGLPPE